MINYNNGSHDINEETARFINYELEKREYSIRDVSKWLNRSYSYAYARLRGDDSFTLGDIETIASRLGYASIFVFIRAQEEHIYGKSRRKAYTELDLAANEDINKNLERELDDFGA